MKQKGHQSKVFPRSTPRRGRPRKLPPSLRKHLDEVHKEILLLEYYFEIFFQFRDIVAQSPVADNSSAFCGFAAWAMIGELVHRIDRLCEKQWKNKNKRVLALAAFLEDLKPHAHIVTRESFVEVRPNIAKAVTRTRINGRLIRDIYRWDHANKTFDKLVGKTKAVLTLANIDKDLNRIKAVSKRISKYRNKQLAHMAHDRNRFGTVSVDELVLAKNTLKELADKYCLLIFNWSTGSQIENIDITNIFMKPWISNEEARTALQQKPKKSTWKIKEILKDL